MSGKLIASILIGDKMKQDFLYCVTAIIIAFIIGFTIYALAKASMDQDVEMAKAGYVQQLQTGTMRLVWTRVAPPAEK